MMNPVSFVFFFLILLGAARTMQQPSRKMRAMAAGWSYEKWCAAMTHSVPLKKKLLRGAIVFLVNSFREREGFADGKQKKKKKNTML